MRFFISAGRITLQAEGQEISCIVEEFQQLEPEFAYLPGVYEQWTPSQHYVIEGNDQRGAPEALADRDLYCSRIGQYQSVLAPNQLPQPDPQPNPDPLPNWEGFAAWRYQQPAYLELVDAMPGRVALFEGAIARGEFASAIAILQSVASTGAVPPDLAEALATAARQFNLPEQLIQALLEVLNA